MTYREFFDMLDIHMRSMDDKHGLEYYRCFVPEIAYLVDMGEVCSLDTEIITSALSSRCVPI